MKIRVIYKVNGVRFHMDCETIAGAYEAVEAVVRAEWPDKDGAFIKQELSDWMVSLAEIVSKKMIMKSNSSLVVCKLDDTGIDILKQLNEWDE